MSVNILFITQKIYCKFPGKSMPLLITLLVEFSKQVPLWLIKFCFNNFWENIAGLYYAVIEISLDTSCTVFWKI